MLVLIHQTAGKEANRHGGWGTMQGVLLGLVHAISHQKESESGGA